MFFLFVLLGAEGIRLRPDVLVHTPRNPFLKSTNGRAPFHHEAPKALNPKNRVLNPKP